jgi:hypothetical protein
MVKFLKKVLAFSKRLVYNTSEQIGHHDMGFRSVPQEGRTGRAKMNLAGCRRPDISCCARQSFHKMVNFADGEAMPRVLVFRLGIRREGCGF